MTTPRPSLVRHRDFRNLWIAETISQFGTQVSLLALPWVAGFVLRVDPFQFALLATIEFLPFILFALPAGVWVDRLPRRPILIIADLGRAASLASVPIAYALGGLTIYQLYVVGFINGILTVFFDVAYQSYLPALVNRDQIVEGNSKLEISRSAAQLGGPPAAGVLIAAVTAPFAIVLDSISFLASALFVLFIRKPEPRPERHGADGKRTSMRTEIAEGLRFVLGNRYLRAIAACTGSSNLFSNIGFSIVLLYYGDVLGLQPEQIGIVFALGNVGVLGAALLGDRIARRFGVGRTILGSAIAFGPALLVIALAPREPLPLTLAVLAFGGFVGSASGVVYNITQVSFRQAITPERIQGRMNATMRFIVWGTIPVGNILGGTLGSTIGLHPTIFIGAIGSLFAFVPLLFSPVPGLKEMPEPVEEPGVGDDLRASDEGIVPPTQRQPTPEP